MKPKLTILQILRGLYKFPGGYERIQRVPMVKVTAFKRGVSKSMGIVRYLARTQTPERYGGRVVLKRYVTNLDFHTPKHAKLSCSCEDFIFTWEYALAQTGNADIQYSNGEPSDTRNPAYMPGACKHLVALLNQMVQEGYLTRDFEIPRALQEL